MKLTDSPIKFLTCGTWGMGASSSNGARQSRAWWTVVSII